LRTLVDNHQRSDGYKIARDGVNHRDQRVASGMYFCKLLDPKMVLLK